MSTTTTNELRGQWKNPADVLSLLLLIGGDIVQKAIGQLVGRSIKPFGPKGPRIAITPVAFSSGWVAYEFTNLLSAVGEKRLMPVAENPSIVVNCVNAFPRLNQSWILGRLLRDHEKFYEVDQSDEGRRESIRIDIFELGGTMEPELDLVWWMGWITMLAQIGIAIPPWILHGD